MLNSCYARVVLYHPIHISRLVSTLESLEWYTLQFATYSNTVGGKIGSTHFLKCMKNTTRKKRYMMILFFSRMRFRERKNRILGHSISG